MWIKSLQLNNFRCFEKLKINFERTYTVLIGINGAGKSSILDAISIALGSFLAGLDGVSSNALHQDDVHYRMYEEGSVPNREKQFPTSVSMDAEVNGGIAIQWQRRLNNENGRTTVKEARSIMEYASSLQERVRKGDFSSLSIDKKMQKAVERTRTHNRHIKYKNTFYENVNSIKKLKQYLDANNAKLFIVIPPFTKVYLQGVDSRYIDDFYDFCERTNTLDGFIDCNKFLSYGDELFIDPDHLNDVGAVRFTEDLKMLISNVSMSTIS